RLREVSIVSMGADEETAVSIAASRAKKGNDMDETKLEEVRAEERERLARIEAACAAPHGWGKDEERVADLKARAIEGEIAVEDLYARLLDIMRKARPTFAGIGIRRGASQAQVIEAAVLARMGKEPLAEKTLGERACGIARDLGAAHMLDLCRAALQAEGVDIPSGRMEMVAAAMSTYSLPVALGNAANKLLLSAYEESPATWRAFCQVRSVSDFKPNTAIRPSFTGNLEQVAPGGELKHGSVDEKPTEFKVDTFGKLFGVDRRDLVNDDLGVFEETARALGKAAMRKVSDLVYQVLFANAGGFFGTGNGNYLDGATSTLSIDSLSLAIQAMLTQRDDEDNDLDIRPSTLLVAPENQLTAKAVLESEFIQRMADQPTGNSLKNAVKIEVEPRLSNASKFGALATGKEWFLFASPSACPVIAAFLNGKRTPTVEFFGLDQTVDKLCVSWRCYHDFGTALCDPRAAVASKGE
ncbi:MAG: Mu-like prophage major head subunit gpT family protein, partial [Planctomycetes bacterium]|nr:Mu-like prophage major head subunit gpT family protein [Planctomycetota bacterium]